MEKVFDNTIKSNDSESYEGDIVLEILKDVGVLYDEEKEKEKLQKKKESLDIIKMFRITTFILQKYGDKERIAKAKLIKNKQNRREEYKQIILDSWNEIALHEKPDLDCSGVFFLLKAAGFKMNNDSVKEIAKGEYAKGAVTADSGNKLPYYYEREIVNEEGKNVIKYLSAVFDHHGGEDNTNTSATKYMYEYLINMGFIEDETGFLSEIVDFVTREDNKDYERYNIDDYRGSTNNLFGYKNKIEHNNNVVGIGSENLLKLLKNRQIKNKYLKHLEEKDDYFNELRNKKNISKEEKADFEREEIEKSIEFFKLSDYELESIGVFSKPIKNKDGHTLIYKEKEDRKKYVESAIAAIEYIEKKLPENIVESPIGKVLVVERKKMPKEFRVISSLIDVAIAKGYSIVAKFDNTNLSGGDDKDAAKRVFAVSFLFNTAPDNFSEGFSNVMKEYGMIRIKNVIRRVDNSAKPIDDDFRKALFEELGVKEK